MSFGHNNYDSTLRFSVGVTRDSKGRRKAVFTLRSTPDTPGAKQVLDKDGQPLLNSRGETLWRMEYDYVNGRIVSIADRTQEINGKPMRFLDLRVVDGSETYTISVKRGDRYWVDFLMRLPNLRLSEPVHMSPYSIEDNGKWNMGVAMKQDGAKVERKWTQANNYGNDENGQGGMPPPVKDEFEDKWSFSARDKFLEEQLKPIVEKLQLLNAPAPVDTDEPITPVLEGQQPEEDDLPF